MQMLHPPAVILIMVVFSSQPTSLTEVTVRYSGNSITKTEGLLLSLKCTVEYKTQDCDIQTTWWYKNCSGHFPIMDPNTYLITVNETERAEHRLRNIFLTISSLKLQDSGFYQCDATCLKSGTQAKGHFIRLNVTAYQYKGLKVSTWSGQLKADTGALALSALLLLLCCYGY